MNLEDIKSPLPERKLPQFGEPKTTIENPETEETIKEVAENNFSTNQPQPSTEPQGIKKNILVYGLIGLAGLLILFLVFKVIIPSLTGKTSNIVTLNYWGLWEDPAVVEGAIAEFESKNPGIKINYKKNQRTDYRTRLQGRLTKEDIEDIPDIFRIHQSWVPNFREYVAEVPANTASAIGLDGDFYETYKKDIKEGGKYLGVPLMYDGLSLFYNKELIDAAQVDIPKSWWSLKSAAIKLTVKDEVGNIKIAGAALGLTDNVDHWSDIVGLMMKQNGVDMLARDEKNINRMQDVLAYYTQFRTEAVWDESLPSSTEAFASGRLAFYFAPSWRVFNLEEMNPNLKFEIATVPQLPTLENVPLDQIDNEANLTNIHWSSYWFEAVNRNSKHQKEAWKFLEYLASKEGLEQMYKAQSQIRSFGEIYPRKSMAELIETNAKIKPFIQAANNASGGYLSSRTFDSGLNDEMMKYFGDAINSIIQNKGQSAEVMTTLTSGIEQLKTKYKIN